MSKNGDEFVVEVGNEERKEAKGSESSAPKQRKLDGIPSSEISICSPNSNIDITSEGLTKRKSDSSSGKMSVVPDQADANSPKSVKNWAEKDYEELYNKQAESSEVGHRKNKFVIIEWIIFLCILGVLLASLTVEKVENYMVLGLEIWKWCVLVMVIFCGMFITKWVMHVIFSVIGCHFSLKEKVSYYVHGIKTSVQVFMWFALVLLTWLLLFHRAVERSKTSTKIFNFVTQTLVSVLIGAFLGLLKNLLFVLVAAKFEMRAYFYRIQESLFHQYALKILVGPPVVEWAVKNKKSHSSGHLSLDKDGKDNEPFIVNVEHHLIKMKKNEVSAWTMNVMVNEVITKEIEAKDAAHSIFSNVLPDSDCIKENDLQRYMTQQEVDHLFKLFGGAKDVGIDRNSLEDWVVKCYNGRKALTLTVNNTKIVLKQLDKFFTSIVIVITILGWLVLVQIATKDLVVVILTQFFVATFIFGNTCQNIFEAIIFIFVTHPFDVGDCIVVDDVQLKVKKMNILNTVFLKLNNEVVYYPNSELSTKTISNYYRSPHMKDTVEFSIASRSTEKMMSMLTEKINKYLERTHYWDQKHNLEVIDIEDMNKLKMVLHVKNTMNFQEFGEKNKRRTELVMEVINFLEELKIIDSATPQEAKLNRTKSDGMELLPGPIQPDRLHVED